MKIFLSWSGDISHNVSIVFRDWLPSVIQSVEPYVSSEDIDKGTRWSTDIAKELEYSSYGILCITRENIFAPWINFEAGALSKAFEKSNVTPFLFDLKRSDIKEGPLLQFQSTIFTKSDVYKLIVGINNALGDYALPLERIKKVYEVWWPELNKKLSTIQNSESIGDGESDSNSVYDKNDILEELLELARTQLRLLKSPEKLLPPYHFYHIINRKYKELRLKTDWFKDLNRAFTKLNNLTEEAVKNNNETVPLKNIEEIIDILRKPLVSVKEQKKEALRRGLDMLLPETRDD